MISRQWRGLARAEQACAYEDHLRTETFPALRKMEGFVDASILKRRLPSGVECLIVTRWTSMAAIEKFAGADTEVAVVPANVRRMMVEFDERVRHYGVLERHRDLQLTCPGTAGAGDAAGRLLCPHMGVATEPQCSVPVK
jgi:heme-degrading monooxygenase HmoA